MSLITLSEAKLHLRVYGTDEDTLIQAHINAAELAAAAWIDRNIYATQDALNTAVAAVPAALTAATSTYEASSTTADAITNDVEREVAQKAADDIYAAAQKSARMTHAGIVINDMLRAAILLTVGHLYANREATLAANVVELPMGVKYLLQPFQAYA